MAEKQLDDEDRVSRGRNGEIEPRDLSAMQLANRTLAGFCVETESHLSWRARREGPCKTLRVAGQ